MANWQHDDGLTDVTSAFQGITHPLHEIIDDIHRRGWTVSKLHVKDGVYVALGKNPHKESLEATGRTDATAAANLLVKIMRREFMRGSAVREAAWDHRSIEQQLGAIAQAYAGAPVYEPKAATAWMELAQDCSRRAQTIRTQLAVEYTNDPIPYESTDDLREDVTNKRHILVTRAYAHHPVWSEQQMLDYRLVVDCLGHAASGGDWGWHGTCLAFAQLAPLLAEAAQKALYTELLGQGAFGSFYRQWGPQKICFLEDLVQKAQEKENKPGHHPVHPSQSLVPGAMPSIFSAVVGTPADPNADWESGVQPLQDNAYLWQRQDGVDPLNAQSLTDALHPLEIGLSRMHPQMAKQSVVNALRSSLLGSRNNAKGHAMHYQTVAGIPAEVDDPIAYWDALEQAREQHNQSHGYAPGSHKQHWAEEQQFKQWVKAANPQLDDGEVQRLAKRELLHILTEEEERVLAEDQGEQLPAEVIEHETYEALRRRLKGLTKSNVDQKVDFGEDHLFHEAGTDWETGPDIMYHVAPSHLRDAISREGLTSPYQDGKVYMSATPGEGALASEPNQLDVWRINTAGLPISSGDPSGWEVPEYTYAGTIPPSRLSLVHQGDPEWDRFQRGESSGDEPRTSTHHADMYPPYLTSRMRPMAQVSRNANALAEAAREDLVSHKGHGHHFRSTALSLGIPGVGPRQVSNAWLHLAPQTSQLGIVNPEVAETLGHDYATETTNRDYFKHERELAAGRDASGYGHVPLGPFSTGLWDLYAGGPGWHPDRTPFKAHMPVPHHTVDWDAQVPPMTGWPSPYWWESTQEARDGAAQDFDRSVGVNFNRDEVPFQKTAMAERSGFPDLDQAIEEFMQAHPEIQEMRNPQNAWGRCEEIAEQCADFLKQRGFRAYAPSDELGAFEGYHDAQDSAAIGAGDFSYPEHAVVEVYGMYGPNNVNNVYIDFTASQYGYTEFPKVHGGRLGSAAASTDSSPWVTDPTTGQRLTGAPGTTLMQHLKDSFGHPDCQSVWDQDYEVGKGTIGLT